MSETAVSGDAGRQVPAYGLGATVPSLPGMADIEVEPHRVLDVARIVEAQADALQDKLRQRLSELRIATPSPDVVSRHAIAAWNVLVSDGDQSYAEGVKNYVQGLRHLADQLRRAAQQYELGEEQKAASLGDRRAYPG
jgi:hypothetical protein